MIVGFGVWELGCMYGSRVGCTGVGGECMGVGFGVWE